MPFRGCCVERACKRSPLQREGRGPDPPTDSATGISGAEDDPLQGGFPRTHQIFSARYAATL
jgi:hypothetical protein